MIRLDLKIFKLTLDFSLFEKNTLVTTFIKIRFLYENKEFILLKAVEINKGVFKRLTICNKNFTRNRLK